MSNKKEATFELDVQLVPVSGSTTTKTVTVTASATLLQVAKAAGLENLDKKNFFVDNKPATAETLVTSGSKVKITERAQGS